MVELTEFCGIMFKVYLYLRKKWLQMILFKEIRKMTEKTCTFFDDFFEATSKKWYPIIAPIK